MPVPYQSDIEAILARRHDNGADYWATSDGRLIKGSPFSTLDSAYMLAELGMDPTDPVLQGACGLIWAAQREDGRFRLAPEGAIYPCQTIHAARTLCQLGYASDPRLERTFRHLLETQYGDGGWRCNKFSFGRGPETEYSNPGPTLMALDAFRFTPHAGGAALARAAEFLLSHWTIRRPIGPCQYGIGTLFMQTAYPFGAYNLFYYVYVLSFYENAKNDPRFFEALRALQAKLADGKLVVERPNPKLASFACCKKGQPSDLATARYREILQNLE